jgi:predicted RND superfamily exporter protein
MGIMKKLFKYPALLIIINAAVTVFFAAQIPRAELDNNNTRFIPETHEARVVSEYIDETFDPSLMILVGLERPYGTVFDPEFLGRLREYGRAVETVEFVKTVNSIMSTQYITGDGDSITVTDLVPEDFAGTPEEITELRRRIASWDLYSGVLVSDNLSAAQIIVSLDVKTEDAGIPEVTASLVKIRETAKEMFAGFAEVYVTGLPVISATINEAMGTDLLALIPLSALVVLAVLFFSFRRFTFVALPLLTVLVAVVWTVGAMPLFGIKLSILSAVLPVILIAVGSAYGIHIVTHYIDETRKRALTVDEHRALVFLLMSRLIKPVFLAALTTFSGFVSFCFTSIPPIREFGYFSSFGVIASFTAAVTLIPSLLLIRGPRAVKERRRKTSGADRVNAVIGDILVSVAQKRILVLTAAAAVIAVSGYGLSKLVVDNSTIDFFRNDTDISRSDRFIREYFGGSRDITILVEADTSEEMLNPAVLSAVDGLSAYLIERVPEVGKTMGFTDVIKRVNQVFNADESPDGLRPAAADGAPSAAAGDGFGFGFGDFGGDGYVPPDVEPKSAPPPAAEQGGAPPPDILAILDAALGRSPVMTGAGLVREVERLTNYNGFSYYEIPVSPERYGKKTQADLRRLVSNYLVLISGNDSFKHSNDPLEPSAIKTMVQLRTTGNNNTKAVVRTIKKYIDANFPETVRVRVGGSAMMEGAVADLVVNSQIISIAVSIIMVIIICALSWKSAAAGIIAGVPLVIAVMCNFAAMGLFGINLNIGTALIASLSVGIGIDYMIHFIDFFKREYEAGGDFLKRTFTGCGKAIIINAVSVGAGFAELAFSQFRILSELGALVALSMVISAVVSLTVIPALLMTAKPKFIYGRRIK